MQTSYTDYNKKYKPLDLDIHRHQLTELTQLTTIQ